MGYVALLAIAGTLAVVGAVYAWRLRGNKALRYAITLKHNQGAFIGLCVKKRWNYWTFVDIRIVPTNPGGHVEQVNDVLHVPYRNILYYQEIANVAE